jgi:hypothetical protein
MTHTGHARACNAIRHLEIILPVRLPGSSPSCASNPSLLWPDVFLPCALWVGTLLVLLPPSGGASEEV